MSTTTLALDTLSEQDKELLTHISRPWLTEALLRARFTEARRLREELSSVPFYAEKAAQEGQAYWASRVVSYGKLEDYP